MKRGGTRIDSPPLVNVKSAAETECAKNHDPSRNVPFSFRMISCGPEVAPVRMATALACGLISALASRPCAAAPGGAAVWDARAIATAAVAPMWRVLNLSRDISRFILVDVAPAVGSASPTFHIPGRAGYYSVQWYDADGDRTLSRGDGLDLDFSGCAPAREPDWDGVVRAPDLGVGPARLWMPFFYADLRRDGTRGAQYGEGIDERERMVGSLAITWSNPPGGESLSVYQGASGFSLDASSGGTFLRRIALTFSCPQRGDFQARLDGEIYDRRFGQLTLVTSQPFKGPCDGAPGSAASGVATVLRALGGSVAVRMTAPGLAVLEVDVNGDGQIDQRLQTNWAALTEQR